MSSYAVLWSEPGRPTRAGKLELEPTGLRLEGSLGERATREVHRIFYEDVETVHVGRSNRERIAGRPSLVIDLAVGGPLRIGSLQGLGVLSDLAEQLGHLTATAISL